MTTLRGQFALVTGGTHGIGLETAVRLAEAGAHVILIGRSAENGAHAVKLIRARAPECLVEFQAYDLALMHEVERLAEWLRATSAPLTLIVHCAGVMLPKRTLTREGMETVFAVQYLARVELTRLLIDWLPPECKIVNVSAGGTMPIRLDFGNLNGEKWYNGVYALIHESIANDLAALRLTRCYPHVRFYNYGPFYVRSGLFDSMPGWFKLLINTGGRLVATTTERAGSEVAALLIGDYPGGMYSRGLKLIRPSRYRADHAVQDRLWAETERLIDRAMMTDIPIA